MPFVTSEWMWRAIRRIARQSRPNPTGHTAMRILDQQEKAIVRRLIRDPRESDNGVGELTGVNVRTVSRKRQRLEQEGILSYYANVALSTIGTQQFPARHLYII